MGAAERVACGFLIPSINVGNTIGVRVAFRVSGGIFGRDAGDPRQPAAGTLAGAKTQLEMDQHRLFPPQRANQRGVFGNYSGGGDVSAI